MNIHTRLVGAFDAVILFLTTAVSVMTLAVLLDPSFASYELLGRRGTVTIQQLAVDDTVDVRHL